MQHNDFGNLVRAYRKQRGWTQEELASRWGYTRAYVTQVESGKKKLDKFSQINRLADILEIPKDQLDAIGRGIPEREKTPSQIDDNILQMLLAPGRDMVRLSYVVWIADQHPVIEENLRNLVFQLDQALTFYNGEFTIPAKQLLAYAHQMQGRIAFDRLDLSAASGHFSDMIELGEELHDPDIILIGMVYRGSILRKRKRFESSVRSFKAAEEYVKQSSESSKGTYYINLSTVYADSGDVSNFLSTIDTSLEIVEGMKDSIASMANEFSLDDVLWAKAGGLSELWRPEEALKVYKETDRLKPFRPLREQGAYTIDKGEALLKVGDLDRGIAVSLKGLQLAEEYRSKRHIGWLSRTYSLIRETDFGKDKKLEVLREALEESQKKQANW